MIVAVGCGSCDDGPPSELRVGGDHPFVRCLAREPGDAREWQVGEARLALADRTLEISGLSSPKLVAFAGPGPSEAALDAALEALSQQAPAVVFVVGSIGDAEPVAKRTLAALAGLDVPVLVLAGGRDDATVWEHAFSSLDEAGRDRVIDATALDRIVLGDREWVPIAGAPRGRYARTDTSCGFTDEDLDARAERLPAVPEGRTRFLLSWAAPAGFGLRGLTGRDPGDPALAAAAERMGIDRGLFAWPAAAATDRATMLLPIAGPATELPDGTRLLPGPVALE